MKKLAFILSLLLALCGCGGAAAETPTPTPTPPPSFENPSGIYADWSKLKKAEPLADVGTRLSDGPLEEFIPSDDYGTLIPYIGNVLVSDHEGLYAMREYRYGLVTKDGCVVLDPILTGAETIKTDKGFFHILYKNVGEGDNMHSVSAICAYDGSWCTDFVYSGVWWNGEYIRAYNYEDPNKAALLDYNGNVVLTAGGIDFEEELSPNYDDKWMRQYSVMNFSGGYVCLELQDGRAAYFDMNGKILRSDEFDGYAYSRYVFSDKGVVPVKTEPNGFYGLLNSKGQWVVPPDNGQDFYEVQVQDGGFILRGKEGMLTAFDDEGNMLCNTAELTDMESPGLHRLVNGWCITGWDRENELVYDLDLNLIARPNKDTWVDSYNGYALIITNIGGQNGLLVYDGAESVFIPGEFKYFSPGGEYIATVSADGSASLYSADGQLLLKVDYARFDAGVTLDAVTGEPYLNLWANGRATVFGADGNSLGNVSGQIIDGCYAVVDETGSGVKNQEGEYIFRKQIDFTD